MCSENDLWRTNHCKSSFGDPRAFSAVLSIPRGRVVSISTYFSYNYKNTWRDPHSPARSSHTILMSFWASFFMLDVTLVRRNVWKWRWWSLFFYIFTGKRSRSVGVFTGGCTHAAPSSHTHALVQQCGGVCHVAVVGWNSHTCPLVALELPCAWNTVCISGGKLPKADLGRGMLSEQIKWCKAHLPNLLPRHDRRVPTPLISEERLL